MPRGCIITRGNRQYLVDGSGVHPLRPNVVPVATPVAAVQEVEKVEKAPASPEPEDIFHAISQKLGQMCVKKQKK